MEKFAITYNKRDQGFRTECQCFMCRALQSPIYIVYLMKNVLSISQPQINHFFLQFGIK